MFDIRSTQHCVRKAHTCPSPAAWNTPLLKPCHVDMAKATPHDTCPNNPPGSAYQSTRVYPCPHGLVCRPAGRGWAVPSGAASPYPSTATTRGKAACHRAGLVRLLGLTRACKIVSREMGTRAMGPRGNGTLAMGT